MLLVLLMLFILSISIVDVVYIVGDSSDGGIGCRVLVDDEWSWSSVLPKPLVDLLVDGSLSTTSTVGLRVDSKMT